jgi:hypothetical protein
MRARTGRPHWFVLEEAHHLLPTTWRQAALSLPQQLGETLLITVHPDHVAPAILAMVDVVVAVGRAPLDTFRQFAATSGSAPLSPLPNELASYEGDVMCWLVRSGLAPFRMRVIHGKAQRLRHIRKYAVGDMKTGSFWFRGPKNIHNLSAPNLSLFCHIGRGIDQETWLYHLRRGDFSRWIRKSVKDEDLAVLVQQIEQDTDSNPQDTRNRICGAIEARYTLAE